MRRLLNFLLLPSYHSSNVYAVNRNIEDPAKITPLVPSSLDPKSKVSTVMEPEEVGPTIFLLQADYLVICSPS